MLGCGCDHTLKPLQFGGAAPPALTPDLFIGFLAGAAAGAAATFTTMRHRRKRQPGHTTTGPDSAHSIELVVTNGRLVEFAAAGFRANGRRWRTHYHPPADSQ